MAEHAPTWKWGIAIAGFAAACGVGVKYWHGSSKFDLAKLAAAAKLATAVDNVTQTIKDMAPAGELPPSQAWRGALCVLTDRLAVFRRLLAKDKGLSAELEQDDALDDPPSPLNALDDCVCMVLGRHIFACQTPSAISFPSMSPKDYT